ncbi:MAG: CopG family transcriptional regulator [Armatimonadetes bacterium]|nr:CopG family transcriptional regulator [Armatimonadota bacterium]
MVVAQVELTDEEAERLEALAQEKQVSVSEIIRDAVQERLRHPAEPTMAEKRRRAMSIPSFPSDVTDLGRNHDRYLAEAFESWQSS